MVGRPHLKTEEEEELRNVRNDFQNKNERFKYSKKGFFSKN
jgi:hypothetical protein